MVQPDPLSSFMRRLGALVLGGSLSLGTIAACGDDKGGDGGDGCVRTAVDEFPDGAFGNPEEVSFEGFDCPEGGLADVDLNGRWSLSGQGQFNFQMPLIHESCEDGFQIELDGSGDPLIHRDDTSIFIREAIESEDFSYVVATRVCGGPGADDGVLSVGQCYEVEGQGSQCFSSEMKRFGRPDGESDAEGLELVSEWRGGDAPWPDLITTNIKVADGVAFLSSYGVGGQGGDLRIVDVSDPANPSDLAVVPSEDDPRSDFNDVKLFQAEGGTFAILAGGLCPIVDARDPANPVIVAKLGEYAHSIFIRYDDEGHPLAYLANYEADTPIFDLSDPANPALVERVPNPPPTGGEGAAIAVHDLFAEPDRLYLNGTTEGFVVMDRADNGWVEGGRMPSDGYSHANWVGEVAGRRIAIHGDEGFNAHLRVVDVDPASKEFMTTIGEYQTRPEVSIHNMMLFGERVYFTYYHDGVRILDLADPTSPQLLAYYHTWDVETGLPGPFEGAIGLDVDQEAGLIWVADISRGLLVLRETK
jgi:hypothetical protein